MFQEILSMFSAVAQAMSSNGLGNMDLTAMHASYMSNFNAQAQAAVNHIIQTNMNNPAIQQQYHTYRQQGGMLPFPAYCQRYAETGGFTPQGCQADAESRARINQQDAASYNAYRQHSQQLQQQTTDYRNAVQDRIAEQRGETLSGQSPYQNSCDGSTWQLPNTASPGDVFRDPASGNVFVMDVHGQYWMNNGQGWWQAMNGRQ